VIEPVLMTAAALGSSSPPLPGFLNALASPLQNYGYWAIGLLVLVEDFGIPVPGETILIAGAIYAGADRLNIVAVGVVAFITAILGDNIGFAIGHFGGRALVLRWGKYVFLTEERLNRAEHFFERHGGKIITVARFIEGLRQANGIIAGISGMHWRRFLAFNALGAALWVGTWASLGYLAGNHITTIYHYITQYSYYVLIAVVVLLVAYIIWRLRGRSRHHMPAVTSAAAEVTPSDPEPEPEPEELTPSEPTGDLNGALESSERASRASGPAELTERSARARPVPPPPCAGPRSPP
jgi:membrane protein DedA with SNARE-associated domain